MEAAEKLVLGGGNLTGNNKDKENIANNISSNLDKTTTS